MTGEARDDARRPTRLRRRGLLLASAWLSLLAGTSLVVVQPESWAQVVAGVVPNVLLVACGTIIVRRADAGLVGWLLIIPGALFPWGYITDQASVGGDDVWLVIGRSVAGLGALPLMLLVLSYPTGRFPNVLARRVARLLVVVAPVAVIIQVALVLVSRNEASEALADATILLYGVLAIVALANQAHVYGQRSRIEQLQLKWFLLAIGGLLVYPLAILLELPEDTFYLLDALSTSLWPITILLAITRYRLYEIDRIISRTLAYAAVIGVSAALFVGGVATITTLLPTQDRLAVAVTTILVVALFNPLRRRLVEAIDRRFDRTRYETQQVIERFGRSIQVETDVDAVRDRLHAAIARTTAPSTVAVWEPRTVEPVQR